MADQPEGCIGCPLYGVGKGFVLGTGDPQRAKYAFVLEAPGREEPSIQLKPVAGRAFFATKEECDREIAIRRRDYPELGDRHVMYGAPVVGATGAALQFWIWPKVGIRREECYLDNTIRCLPPKGKSGGAYPTGAVRAAAEKHCRRWDRISAFRPDTMVFSIHPASLLREIGPLPLAVKDAERVRDFTVAGRKVLALLGGKAIKAFARFGENSTRWRGHYFSLASGWENRYKEIFEEIKKIKKKAVRMTPYEKDEDLFGISPELRKRMREKATRPDVLDAKPCASHKRYKGKRPPKCGCAPCWDRFEEVQRGSS